jgi:hypothetical protein
MRSPGRMMMGLGHEFSVAGLSNLFLTLAEVLLLVRVVLKFFFTTASGGFVHWAYATTNVLLEPFRGVFPNPTTTPTNWHVDWVALFAMMVYAVVGGLLIGLVTWNWGVRAARNR